MRKNGGYRRRKDGVFAVVYRCPNCHISTVPNKISQFGVTCLKCGSRMRKNGRYKRKGDGITVTVYYCTNCRRARVNRPLRGKRRIDGEAILDRMLGPIARINRCPTGGGKLVRNGFANLKNGFKIQTYVCKVCGKSTRLTSVIRRLQRCFHPPCPLCGGKPLKMVNTAARDSNVGDAINRLEISQLTPPRKPVLEPRTAILPVKP